MSKMTEKIGPYIGVTGFMSRAEVEQALEVVPRKSTHRLMVGVLMSSKTLAGQLNKYPGRYPKKETVADIFIDDPRVLNLVHYNTAYTETLTMQLMEITKIAGPHLDGFQLNIAWPPALLIKDYLVANPGKYIVLQIGSTAMAQAGSIERFKKLVDTYLPMVDSILIDPSGGKGEPFDAVKGIEYLDAIYHHQVLGLGIAGGLGPNTLHLLNPVVGSFPDLNLSIDAEGRLRIQPEDKLCIDSTKTYLKKAFALLTL